MKSYKILQGYYGEVTEKELILPDDFQLITGGPNDIGNLLREGHCHYLGCMKKDDYEKCKDSIVIPNGSFKEFGSYMFICIHNVKEIDHLPVVSSDEFNSNNDFGNYFIATWSRTYNLVSIAKILRIDSEFNVKAIKAHFYSAFDDSKSLAVMQDRYGLYDLIGKDRHCKKVVTDNPNVKLCMESIIDEVLGKEPKVDLFAANQLFSELDFNDYIHQEKIDLLGEYMNFDKVLLIEK